ncbi:chitin deacetylase 7-like [Haliotis asinina]|uniref:chitin deacetylase 7-like n=1 Tax=Haliotis asinina TaxID=109174 RepID=UPI003531D8BB
MVLSLVLLCGVLASVSAQCQPGGNCQLPDCRCWFDEDIPGSLAPDETPQVVLVTFEDAVNEVNADIYRSLFTDTNPNGCPVRGTFFIKDLDTNYDIVRDLFDDGHEIGANSLDGSYPTNEEDWRTVLQTIKDELADVGIARNQVKGVRAPQLRAGGIDEFIGMGENDFDYDASCISSEFNQMSNLKWPYTYDFIPGPRCNDGQPPNAPFPGKWQFLVASLDFNGTACATPSACTNVFTQSDVFDLFFDSFAKHYDGDRSPFTLIINPDFVLVPFKLAGLKEFLEYIRAAFEDTWILPMNKALDWIRDPTPNLNITTFQPWSC